MTMKTQTITRAQVVDLVMRMPPEKLSSWYEYGLFIQNHPIFTATDENGIGMAEQIRYHWDETP